MSNPDDSLSTHEPEASFGDMLSQFERKQSVRGGPTQGVVVSITSDAVFLDLGLKTEGTLPLQELGTKEREALTVGAQMEVTIKGRDPGGYYQLTRSLAARPSDWTALERAFTEKTAIMGTVTGVVKGGLSVDVGIRAFLPASRSGARDLSEMEKLVGQEIRCRITKLDSTDEDVVIDRRVLAEEEEQAARERRYQELKEGARVNGTVRSLTDYGAFVDLGGIDALLHVGDISWGRLDKPGDAVSIGQQIEAKVLKVDRAAHRIAIGMKQLEPDPWEAAPGKYTVGQRVKGTVTRVTDFGAFVELEPGIEGLIHVSEMSWAKKVRKPGDLVKPGESVEVVVLGLNAGERRMSLGLKQALGDPWADAAKKFSVGSVVEGSVVNLTKFGAFVQLAEGIEGMIHVSDLSAEKRINHPQDVLRVGQLVRAQVLELDRDRRRLKLGIKQLAPTSIDEYIAEHREGDIVSGRAVEVFGASARIELGEGIHAACPIAARGSHSSGAEANPLSDAKPDLASLTSMLKARWKGGVGVTQSREPERLEPGQVRSFRITRLDLELKKIDVQLV